MSHLGDRITALIDQKLDPASREQVLRHLLSCAECQAEADRERSVRRALSMLGDAADHQPPAPLQARLLALAEMEQGWPAQRPSVWPAARPTRQRGKARFLVAGSLSLGAATVAMAFVVGGQPTGPTVAPEVDSYTRDHAVVGGGPLADYGTGTVTKLTESSGP